MFYLPLLPRGSISSSSGNTPSSSSSIVSTSAGASKIPSPITTSAERPRSDSLKNRKPSLQSAPSTRGSAITLEPAAPVSPPIPLWTPPESIIIKLEDAFEFVFVPLQTPQTQA